MNLLLDTHALIWFAENSPTLSKPAREALEDAENDLHYSVASIWEIAIKASLGKLKIRVPLDPDFRKQLEESGFAALSIEYAHAASVLALPWHHRDPFDRLLVAQALREQMLLVSHDRQLDAYQVKRVW
jgi:PIN domain nuclease of toxin-antitoxin system